MRQLGTVERKEILGLPTPFVSIWQDAIALDAGVLLLLVAQPPLEKGRGERLGLTVPAPGLHRFLLLGIGPGEQGLPPFGRFVAVTITPTNTKTPTPAVAPEGRWPTPVRTATCQVNPSRTLRSNVRPLEQPQRLRLLLVCFSLGVWSLRRPLLTPGPTPGRGSGSLMSGILGFVLLLGSRPFDHRRDLLGQPGQVSVVEGLDVRVRRRPLHADGGPASLDGHDDFRSSDEPVSSPTACSSASSESCGSCVARLRS